MKTKEHSILPPSESIPDFHAVDFFRAVKERIARELSGKTFEEQERYIKKRLLDDRLTPHAA